MTPQIPMEESAGDLAPEFALSAWIGDDGDRGEINILVHTRQDAAIERHASMALLYGLAILALDQQGTIQATIDQMLAAGPINEIEAVNRINFLLKEDANEAAV